MSTMTPKQKVEALTELEAHPGWQIVLSRLKKEIAKGSKDLASPNVTDKPEDLHFWRGSLYAAFSMLKLVERCKQDALAEAPLHKQSPATAGRGDLDGD